MKTYEEAVQAVDAMLSNEVDDCDDRYSVRRVVMNSDLPVLLSDVYGVPQNEVCETLIARLIPFWEEAHIGDGSEKDDEDEEDNED